MTGTLAAMGTSELPPRPAAAGQAPVSGQGPAWHTAGVAAILAGSVSAGLEGMVEQQVPAGHRNQRSESAIRVGDPSHSRNPGRGFVR